MEKSHFQWTNFGGAGQKYFLFALAFLAFSVATNAQTRRGASLAEQKMCSERAEKFLRKAADAMAAI